MAKERYKWLRLPPGHVELGPKFYREVDEKIDKLESFFYIISGIPRSGKSTLIDMIMDAVKRSAIEILESKERTPRFEKASTWSKYISSGVKFGDNPTVHSYLNELGWYGNTLDIWSDYMDTLRSDYPDKAEALERRRKQLCKPIMFLDDLGLEATTDSGSDKAAPYIGKTLEAFCGWVKENQIYRDRYSDKDVEIPKFSIITTLITPAGKDEEGFESVSEGLREIYGGRIAGRLLDQFEIKMLPRKDFSEAKQRCEVMK